MYQSKTQLRIHYALTDQMGVVYHGRYAEFFEIGRTEALRSLGTNYKEVEKSGTFMAVTEMQMRFLRPAKYDDLITIVTTLRELPKDHKITFYNEIFNEENELLTAGHVTLYFLETSTMKKTVMPEIIREKINDFF